MEILYLFEKIRNPVCNFLFSAVTYFGDELLLMLIAITLFWCINKRSGYFMLISGFFGTIINQTLKLACKIPRPWVKDPGFTIYEPAREAATGYSFPSGHSQNAVTIFGSIFLTTKQKWLKIVAVVFAVLVPVSRMYLGVHTFWDVLAGSACAVMILLLLENIFKNDKLFDKAMPILVAVLTLGAVAFFLYTILYPHENSERYDPTTVESALKNACTMLGCSAGIILVYFTDRYVTKFDTKASWYVQILKLVIGFGIILAIKTFVKIPLLPLMGQYERIIRYFLIVAFGGAVWPLAFKYFVKIKIPALDRFGRRIVCIFTKEKYVPEVEKSEEVIPKKKTVFVGVKNKNTSKKKK